MQSQISITIPKLILFFGLQIAILAIITHYFSRWQTEKERRITNKIELVKEETTKAIDKIALVGKGLTKMDTLHDLLFIQLEIQEQALEITDKTYQLNRTRRRSKQKILEAQLESAMWKMKELKKRALSFEL